MSRVWGFAGKDGSWVHDGVRLEFDPVLLVVNLMMGNLCVDQITIYEFERIFGFRAASLLSGGRS